MTLGIELNNDGLGHPLMTSFDGQSVTPTDVLVKYTTIGDADLSGSLNATDYTLLDNGFNNHLTGWRNGDFNYDGVINGDDYTLLDNAYNEQIANSFSQTQVASATAQIANPGVSSKTSIAAVAVASTSPSPFSTSDAHTSIDDILDDWKYSHREIGT